MSSNLVELLDNSVAAPIYYRDSQYIDWTMQSPYLDPYLLGFPKTSVYVRNLNVESKGVARQDPVDHPSQTRDATFVHRQPAWHLLCLTTPTMKIRLPAAWQTLALILLLGGAAEASLGDRLPDFKECVQVR